MRRKRNQAVSLVIVATEPIGRHQWLNLAVATPALRLVQGGAADRQVFAFREGAPELTWADGRILVSSALPDDMADLEGLAAQLGGHLERSDSH